MSAVRRLALARCIEDIERIALTTARRLTGADGATFELRDGMLSKCAAENVIAPVRKRQRFPIGTCVSAWTMRNRTPAVIEDVSADDRIQHDAYRSTFAKSMAVVPVRASDPVAAIGACWATRHELSGVEVELLQALADSTAVAIEGLGAHRELDEGRLETLQRLALAAEHQDDDTYEHTERVGRSACSLADQLGLAEAETSLVRQAAPLHDIGKLAVSDAILLKPGTLEPEEVEEVKKHAAAGAAILSGTTSDVLRLAREIALAHHEWWNGGGYPAGLTGDEIPVSGRIVAVVDVFDALTHERPYKPAWPVAEAVAEIVRLRGAQFDPDVVDAFGQLDPRALA